MTVIESEAHELDFLHWMVFGTRAGVVGGSPITFPYLEGRIPHAFDDAEVVSRLVLKAVQMAGRLTPWAARGLVWLCRNRARDFPAVFHSTVNSAEELLVFASTYSRSHAHWGKMAKEHIAQWLELRLDEVEVAGHRKYHHRHRHSLADLVRLSHPTFGGRKSPVVDWLLGRETGGRAAFLVRVDLLRTPGANRELLLHALRGTPRVPSPLAEMAAGSDPDLWHAAIPSLSLEALLAGFPRRAVGVEAQRAVVARLKELAPLNVPRLLRAAWKVPRVPETLPFREALGQLLWEAAKAIPRPPGRTLVLIDRSASCPPAFFREALAAAAFGPSRLYLVDDVVEEVSGRPMDLLQNLGAFAPRGGSGLHKPLQLALASRDFYDRIMVFSKGYPFLLPEIGPTLAALLERYRESVNPHCLWTSVVPGPFDRIPGLPTHRDRLVLGTEWIQPVLPWLRSPEAILSEKENVSK